LQAAQDQDFQRALQEFQAFPWIVYRRRGCQDWPPHTRGRRPANAGPLRAPNSSYASWSDSTESGESGRDQGG
jgi:hypothetical protein